MLLTFENLNHMMEKNRVVEAECLFVCIACPLLSSKL